MREDLSSLFSRPEFKETLARYENMLSQGKRVFFDSDELTLLAEYYASKGKPEASDKVIDYALTLYPDNQDVLIFKCHSLLSTLQIPEAEHLIRTLPDQSDYEAKLLYGELYLLKGETNETQQLFNDLYESYPETDTALDIAQLYMDYQMKDYAYPWIQKALRQEPDNLEAIELMACFQYASQNIDEAIDLFNQILDEEPYNLTAWQNLARCYVYKDDLTKALEAIDFAMVADENDLTNWRLKGECHLMNDDKEEALKCFKYLDSHKLDNLSEKGYVWNMLTLLSFEMHQYEEVMAYTQKLIAHHEQLADEIDYVEVCYKRAIASLYLSDEKTFNESVRLGILYAPEDYRTFLMKGEIQLMNGYVKEALASFLSAMEHNPDNIKLPVSIGLVLLYKKYYLEAQFIYQMFFETHPDQAHLYGYFMAFALYGMDCQEQMMKYLIQGAVYTPEVLDQYKNLFIQDEDYSFYDIAKDVASHIQKGDLDPSAFLEPF